MDISNYQKEALLEHRFWLQILGDHSRFILSALSPDEKEEIVRAKMFINIFDDLLDKSREDLTGSELKVMTQQAYNRSCEIRVFKLHLLKRHLTGVIGIKLTPSFINHMLNELEEYLRILCSLLSKRPTNMNPVHYHLLWLLDGTGHAAAIESDLDEVEKALIEKSKDFRKDFEALYMKAIEMAGYMRSGLEKFPALERFNEQAEIKMNLFQDFLKELEELILNDKALGALPPLITDHMFREECYYLTKLAGVSEVKMPDCDPAKPRIQV